MYIHTYIQYYCCNNALYYIHFYIRISYSYQVQTILQFIYTTPIQSNPNATTPYRVKKKEKNQLMGIAPMHSSMVTPPHPPPPAPPLPQTQIILRRLPIKSTQHLRRNRRNILPRPFPVGPAPSSSVTDQHVRAGR